MKTFPKKIFFFLSLLFSQYVPAQVRFSASLSPSQISKDEYTQLKLSVENARDVQDITPPQLKNFTIISGPNQESGMSSINGDVKKYIAIVYILKPRGPGTFTIAPATAIADGATYQSNAVVLKVNNNFSGNNSGSNSFLSPYNLSDPFEETVPESLSRDYILRKGENALDKIKKNMFVKLETNKTSCFVGEPIIAEYKLYTRLKSESSMSKNPSFNGFSVIDLQQPDNMNYTTEKQNGKEYNVYTIRKSQLYPLQPGNLELEVAEIDNNVRFIREEYANSQANLLSDMFRDFAGTGISPEGMEDHRIVLQSKPLSIFVKPLPDLNRPANFKGAVGNFSIESSVDKKKFTTDDAGKLTLVIGGVGNLHLVTAPEINWPEGLEGFEPKITDDLYKTTVPVSGRKIIEYTFTFSTPGTYTIPAAEFSFFDPREGRYKTVTTKPIELTVTKGSGKAPGMVNRFNKPDNRSLLNILFDNRLQVVIILALVIILGLFLWLKYDKKKEKQTKIIFDTEKNKKDAEEQPDQFNLSPQHPLAAAEECLLRNDDAAFFIVLNQALKNYLSGKLKIPVEELNRRTISDQLDKKGISNETCLRLNQLMDEIEWQLYTPIVEKGQMKDKYERANEFVQLLGTYKI